jgi:hypothetical protein
MKKPDNSENWAQLHDWWQLDMHGKPGSAMRKAFDLKLALGCICLLKPKYKTVHSVHERKAIRRNYGFAIMRILRAFEQSDAEFFRTMADGLEQLRDKEDTAIETPLHCLSWTYTFMTSCKDPADSLENIPVPTKAEIIKMTKRQWAICRLNGWIWPPAFIADCDQIQPGLEADIAREMRKLPEQDWTQHFKTLGIVLRNATPGPKPGSKRRIRITRR